MADDKKYWEQRTKQAMQEEVKSDREMIERVERLVNSMYDDIDDAINAFYSKYANYEGLSIDDVKKKIKRTDIQKMKRKASEYVKSKDFSPQANQFLKQYNTAMYVSREKFIKAQLGLIVTYTYSKLESQMYNYMESAYYRSLQQQAGILGESVQISASQIKAIINTPFENVVWSKRLWRDMKVVRAHVQKTVNNVLLRGRHPNEYVAELRKKSGQTTYNIKRLLLTETARVQSEAQKQHLLETLGEDGEYIYLAKLDNRTTPMCRGLDNSVFKVKDLKPGLNAPPMHPFCRSFIAPNPKPLKFEKGKYTLEEW
ncbi:minor capsid protein [Staphylococcus saprophyticus]|uniref:minor capsid protein n=1 Tax=Staphylococcus saprophyticus TaxID=29385 RepID=UPI003BF6EFA9